jgi:hypothetical protein
MKKAIPWIIYFCSAVILAMGILQLVQGDLQDGITGILVACLFVFIGLYTALQGKANI